MIIYDHNIVIASYFHVRLLENAVSLLPIDHAKAFPLCFDIETRKIINGDLNFYNKPFHTNFYIDHYIDPSKCNIIKGTKSSTDLTVYNVLDNCFGHAFLKLLMAIEENTRSNHDGLLIVPSSLAHFVRNGVFLHTIEIDLNYKEFELCWILNKQLDLFIEMKYNIQIFPVHTYGLFDNDILFSGLNVPKKHADKDKSRICFYYRKDFNRKWSLSQKERIIKLYTGLSKFFTKNIKFTVIGAKDNLVFPAWIDDKRVNSFTSENDKIENDILCESLITIGVTGSHMLMPSLLSTLTVHLLPTHKYKNMAEDVVNCTQDNQKLKPYQHVYYFGNSNCTDISASDLCFKILIHFQGLTEKTYKLKSNLVQGQTEWILQQFPYFKYLELNRYRTAVINNISTTKKILKIVRTFFK